MTQSDKAEDEGFETLDGRYELAGKTPRNLGGELSSEANEAIAERSLLSKPMVPKA